MIQQPSRLVLCFLMLCLCAPAATRAHQTPVDLIPGGRDIAATDAFIWQVFSSTEVDNYEAGAAAYLWMLQQADSLVHASDRVLLTRHFRSLAMIVPEKERLLMGLGEASSKTIMDNLAPQHAAQIVTWWRINDNLPATPANERLEEHLRRVVYAQTHFSNERDLRGFDDRGEVFIRLGDPSKLTEVELLTPTLLVNPQNFSLPENEFWVYRHVDYEAQYLFIQKSKRQGFRLSRSTDLIPIQLQNSRRYTEELLAWMEEIYGQLALFHNSYGQQYDELNSYLALPTARSRPDIFARSQLAQANTLDDQNEYQRSQRVPTVYSNIYGIADPLEVDVRWARFLNEDGSTRTEVYWGVDAPALKPSRRLVRDFYKLGHEPSDKYLISVAVAHLSQHFEIKNIIEKHFLLPAEVEQALPARTLIVDADTAGFNLAIEWDQMWVLSGDTEGAIKPGARIKVGTHRINSLSALQDDSRYLEMSDIKPLRTRPDLQLETAAPYPGNTLSSQTPLALYFEIYNLTYGENDNTHYSIDYEVIRAQKRTLFNFKSGNEVTGAQTTSAGASRTAKEFIIPDLIDMDEKGQVEIVVYVTDLTSGQQVNRSILFNAPVD